VTRPLLLLPNLHAIVYEEIVDALPDHDDGEVQDVPGIPQVGVLMLEEALGNDLHDTLGSEDEEEDIFNFFQYSIRLIGVLARKGGVHCQAHAVAHDGEQDEKVKWLPLHKSNAMLSQGIFKREATHGLLSPVRRGLGSHPPCWFLGVHLGHLDFVAIGRRAIQSGVPSRGEVGSFSPWRLPAFHPARYQPSGATVHFWSAGG